MRKKIRTVDEIRDVIACEKRLGRKIVQCHGVFDLLHPGHIRHFSEAKRQGDCLVVSLTPDRFVNKGPGRPVFHEQLRLEQVAALSSVDFVVLNDAPDAVPIIKKVCPNLYVKGGEYRNHSDDVTGKISEEEAAVHAVGGEVYYTDDIVFSSSQLINRFFDEEAGRLAPFFEIFKASYSLRAIVEAVESLSSMRVLVIGDAILDEYQYVAPLGQSGKGHQFTAALLQKELFLGGALIIANHVGGFVKQVDLVTAVSECCPYRSYVEGGLLCNVTPQFIDTESMTLLKKRYVQKDGKTLTKLFETYSTTSSQLDQNGSDEVISRLQKGSYDLVLACDFGNGFTNPAVVKALSSVPHFLAVNTQTNSGNRGFNVITHYQRANYISLNEPELRLAAHDRNRSLEAVAEEIRARLRAEALSITRGSAGVLVRTEHDYFEIPAMTMEAIDRIGAGDCYFALSALCMARGLSPFLAGFVGSVAAAMGVQIVGNSASINKVGLCKYITRLMK